MKEVTYEEWQKNPTPREMWVWDNDDESDKTKRVVLYMHPKESYEFNVIALESPTSNTAYVFSHCAEIEEPKKRRMTNQELTWWLREKPTREYKRNYQISIYYEYIYTEDNASEPVNEDILIREDGGEWREPLVELEE